MRLPVLPLAACLLLSSTAFGAVRPHHHTSTHALVGRSTAAHAAKASHFADHASSGIGTERATEIQSALIQKGYLTGEPTGNWDAASVAAMQKMQSDNGWQTKFVPDSRALIKLGLGSNAPAAASGNAAPSPANTASVAPSTF